MALALEGANKVRQKTRAITLKPGVFYTLKAFFLDLATNKNSPDLEFKVLTSGANATVADAPCRVYAVYARKGPASHTASHLKLTNHASQVQADNQVHVVSAEARETFVAYWPDGKALSTGLAAGSYTAAAGAHETTPSNAADAWSGFVIIGAPGGVST
jgi:hypothetical protein